MMNSARDIARYIITIATEYKRPVSNLKLQLLLYLSWIECYGVSGKELFEDDFCAWDFGPCIPDIYYDYCAYGGKPISWSYQVDMTENVKSMLDMVLNKYLSMTVYMLSKWICACGSAWENVHGDDGTHGCAMPHNIIVEHDIMNRGRI